ncbi:hypothetical protein [Paenibacillus sp. FSL H7-0331]|nr:hypothetical protein [Paenibacillus sp. FSL H7-0331]
MPEQNRHGHYRRVTGDKMQLKGKSVCRIEEGKISLIEDYS